MDEIWKPIPSVPNYEASSWGRIRHSKNKQIRLLYAGRAFSSKSGTKLVSRSVCEAFNGPAPETKPEAAHADGNPLNNGAFNLYWASSKENEDDKKIHGTHHLRRGGIKLSAAIVAEIQRVISASRRTVKGHLPKGLCRDLAARFGTTNSNISAIGRGISWKEGV